MPEKYDSKFTRAYVGDEESGAIRMETLDVENHTAEFVIATEEPVRDSAWAPPTSLSMKGAVLKYYKSNPVVLAQHQHGAIETVGKTLKVWTEIDADGRNVLVARVQFDVDDEFANRVWGKVKRGFLRAASIGFRVTRTRDVEEKQVDQASGLTGPVRIATQWRLLEWSIVAVGADSQALGRADESPDGSGEENCRAGDDGKFTLPTLPAFRLNCSFLEKE